MRYMHFFKPHSGMIVSWLFLFGVSQFASAQPYVYYCQADSPWTLIRIDANGGGSTVIYDPGSDTDLEWARNVAVDNSIGKIYFYDSNIDPDYNPATDTKTPMIFKADLDGSNRTNLLQPPVGVGALEAKDGKLYYTLSEPPYTLRRIDADGTNDTLIYTPSAGWVTDMSIDTSIGKIFIYNSDTDGSSTKKIRRLDMDGGNLTDILVSAVDCLDAKNGKVYYSLSNDPWEVQRRNSDGTGLEIVFVHNYGLVYACAADPTSGKLFFYDSDQDDTRTKAIYKCDLDGSNPVVIKDLGSIGVHDIDVYGGSSNALPVITEGESVTVNMDEDGSPTAFGKTLNATDGDGDTITWSISSGASHGSAGASGTGPSKAISYSPNANYNGSDSFVVQVSDGKGGTDSITVTVNISAQADAPTATNLTQSKTYTEDAASVALENIVVTDPDSGDTVTATLILANISAGSLSASSSNGETYTPGTGEWTVSGSVADVNAALAAVAFIPAANNDVDTAVSTHVEDAAATGPADGSITLDATPVNDAPDIVASSGSVEYTENQPAQVIDATATLSDVEDNWTAGTLAVQITANAETADRLAVLNNGDVSLSGTDVNVSGTGTVGTVNAASVTGSNTLTVTFNASADNAIVQKVLRAVGYDNTSEKPGTNNRTVTFTATDAASGSDAGSTGTRTITVTPQNDAPTDINITNLTIQENAGNAVVGDLSTTDPDN